MQIILEVALITVAREVVILDIEKYSPLTFVGIDGLVLSLAAVFWAVHRPPFNPQRLDLTVGSPAGSTHPFRCYVVEPRGICRLTEGFS